MPADRRWGTSMAVFDPAYFRAQGWWRDETLSDWIDRCAISAPNRAAILAVDRALTYQTLQADVQSLAAGLADAGIGRGDVVVVHLPNVPELPIAWLAINALGAIMQTVHTPYGIRELEHLITHGGGKAAIALARTKDRSPAGDIASLRERIPALRLVIAVGGDVPGAVNFSTLLKQGRGKSPPSRPDANDPFLLLYTSGTTSSPKRCPSAPITFSATPACARWNSA
jgi:acyl-coenzyme A synthetase/AMP-(fatty) acid ligase